MKRHIAALAMLVCALFSSCSLYDCGPTTCTGCCTTDGLCILDGTDEYAGSSGVLCGTVTSNGGGGSGGGEQIGNTCTAANCAGCCDSQGICRQTYEQDTSACGLNGARCSACNTTSCTDGVCCGTYGDSCGDSSSAGCCGSYSCEYDTSSGSNTCQPF